MTEKDLTLLVLDIGDAFMRRTGTVLTKATTVMIYEVLAVVMTHIESVRDELTQHITQDD